LQVAMKWLADHPHDSALFYTLGVLSARNELWGQAYDYYQKSLALNPRAKTYLLFGQLCEKMGKQEQCRESYRKGLMLIDN